MPCNITRHRYRDTQEDVTRFTMRHPYQWLWTLARQDPAVRAQAAKSLKFRAKRGTSSSITGKICPHSSSFVRSKEITPKVSGRSESAPSRRDKIMLCSIRLSGSTIIEAIKRLSISLCRERTAATSSPRIRPRPGLPTITVNRAGCHHRDSAVALAELSQRSRTRSPTSKAWRKTSRTGRCSARSLLSMRIRTLMSRTTVTQALTLQIRKMPHLESDQRSIQTTIRDLPKSIGRT